MKSAAPPVARLLIEEAGKAGAGAADVYVKRSVSREADAPARAGGRSIERGVALRIFLPDGRSALSATTLPDVEEGAGAEEDGSAARALAAAIVRRCVAAAAGSVPRAVLPSAAGAEGRGLGLFDPDLEAPIETLREAAEEIRALAAEAMPGAVAEARIHAVSSEVHLLNSSGFEGSYRHTLARLDLTLTWGRSGRSAATQVVRAARSLRGLAADAAVAEAIALLEERLDPRLPPSGIHEIVLAPRAAAEIVAALAPCLTASLDGSAATLRRGEKVASGAVTITDDGRLPGGVASAPFDGEGTRTRRTTVVERGDARVLLRDLAAGVDAGGSTGNGWRGSFREPPSLRPTNLFIHPGSDAPGDLLASVRQGIRISTLGRIPPARHLDAPFAVPFTGRWIHNGRTGAPLGGGFLAGNLRDMLTEVAGAGSDLTFSHRRGSFGAPTLLLRRAPVRSA